MGEWGDGNGNDVGSGKGWEVEVRKVANSTWRFLKFASSLQGRLGAKTRGGSTPNFESDENESPTELL